LIRALARDSRAVIPSDIATIGEDAFSGLHIIVSIAFAAPSSVHTIRRLAFGNMSLKSLQIPASVRKIYGSAFRDVLAAAFSIDDENPYFYVEGDYLIERSTNRLVHFFSNQPKCPVPSTVHIIGTAAFERNSLGFSVFRIEFPDSSRLMRLEKRAFSWSKLVSLTLPENLEFIDGRAFHECNLQSLKIAAGNRHFEMRADFLVGIPDQRLICYFGPDHDLIIPNDILILGRYSLSSCSTFRSISFADGSQLREIEHCAICDTDLPSFQIPASVE
jgi:hypothetical protein